MLRRYSPVKEDRLPAPVPAAQPLETIASRAYNRIETGCDENVVRALGLRLWLLDQSTQLVKLQPLSHSTMV